MPVQTTQTSYMYFPDGCKVEIKDYNDVSWTDLGAINSAVTATLNWTENQIETANAGKTVKQIKEMVIDGGFTLINLNPIGIEKLGAGMFTQVDTAASPVATIPNQVIAAGWDDNIKYELVMYTSSSDDTKLRVTAVPTLTSVTLDAGGTPETLTVNNDYVIVADTGSYSGWSIVFMSANMSTGSPKTLAITIDYGSNTPVASTTIYAGASTELLNAYALKMTHTDSNSLTRTLELFSVDPNSGGFVFSFKGANEDGLEEMPLTFKAKLDTTLTDGRQLFAWTVDNGAA